MDLYHPFSEGGVVKAFDLELCKTYIKLDFIKYR